MPGQLTNFSINAYGQMGIHSTLKLSKNTGKIYIVFWNNMLCCWEKYTLSSCNSVHLYKNIAHYLTQLNVQVQGEIVAK